MDMYTVLVLPSVELLHTCASSAWTVDICNSKICHARKRTYDKIVSH